MKTCCFIHPRN